MTLSDRLIKILQKIFKVWLLILIFFWSFNQQLYAQAQWQKNLIQYIHNKLEKSDGGYGWEDQPDSHLSPTFAVIGILNDINQLPAKKNPLIQYVRTHHPQYGAKSASALIYKQTHNILYLKGEFLKGEAGASGAEMMNLIYQQIQGILWLGGDVSEFKEAIGVLKSQAGNLANYEENGYPGLIEEMMTPICGHLLRIKRPDSASVLSYLQSRRRENGSFNNSPVKDGGDGNILNTYWSLYAFNFLDKNYILKKETTQWIQSCQLKNGGFTHQPHPVIGANDEVAYTWAAIKALQLLSSEPIDLKSCINYLLSLRNEDGGFGNRPGLASTPMSTYYAIDALKALNAFSYLADNKTVKQSTNKINNDYSRLKIYTVQYQAQGSGSPEEAVELANNLHIDLWGSKNGTPDWVTTAQKIALDKKVPVTFFIADEPYGKSVKVEGMGTFEHILDFIVPAQVKLPEIGKEPSWQEYRKNYLEYLLNHGGSLILQISNNEPLARILLDESIKNGGYIAISTIHFDQDFLFWLPFLNQYRNQLPFIALQDAHGTEAWWWTDELIGYRTLFLAKKPTYDEMMKSLKTNLIVAVRHDSLSEFKTRILGGAAGVQKYVLSQQNKWKWWGNSPEKIIRPWAAITVVNTKDSLEVARPESGVNIRIRCWWKVNRPILKTQVVTLIQLKVDNKIVKPEYIEKKDRRGVAISDSYYLYSIIKPLKGEHIIEATLKNTKDNTVQIMKKKFSINF